MTTLNQLPDTEPRYATLRDYLQVLRERWVMIVGLTLALGAAAFAYSATQPKEYRAAARIAAVQKADFEILIGSTTGPVTNPGALTSQLAAVATRGTIAEATRQALDTDLSAGAIRSKVMIRIDVTTNLVEVSASDGDPIRAAEIANEWARQVKAEAKRDDRRVIQQALRVVRAQRDEAVALNPADPANIIHRERVNRLRALRDIVEPVEIVAFASPPGSAFSPRPVRNVVLGLLAGLFIGVLLAFIRDSLDRRLKSAREMEKHFGLSRLGQLSHQAFTGGNGKQVPNLAAPDLEAAKMIRTNLELTAGSDGIKSVAVTSPLPGDGKSTVAIALASVSAMAGRLTLLIEGDLHQPVLAERLGIKKGPGLSDVLLGQAEPREVLQVVELPSRNGSGPDADPPKLVCITAGTRTSHPGELLTPERLGAMLSKVVKIYETVVVDTPPVLAVADTREILSLVDGVIVCARARHTTIDHAQATREALEKVPQESAGLVVTGIRGQRDDYYSYYYRYAG